jgi:hypothetical protein
MKPSYPEQTPRMNGYALRSRNYRRGKPSADAQRWAAATAEAAAGENETAKEEEKEKVEAAAAAAAAEVAQVVKKENGGKGASF